MSENQGDNSLYPTSGALSVTPPPPTISVVAVPVQATSDTMLVDLWVHGRSRHTQRAYRAEIRRLFAFTRKPLREMRLIDLQGFCDHLVAAGLAPASRNRAIAAVKSLFAFALRLGYL